MQFPMYWYGNTWLHRQARVTFTHPPFDLDTTLSREATQASSAAFAQAVNAGRMRHRVKAYTVHVPENGHVPSAVQKPTGYLVISIPSKSFDILVCVHHPKEPEEDGGEAQEAEVDAEQAYRDAQGLTEMEDLQIPSDVGHVHKGEVVNVVDECFGSHFVKARLRTFTLGPVAPADNLLGDDGPSSTVTPPPERYHSVDVLIRTDLLDKEREGCQSEGGDGGIYFTALTNACMSVAHQLISIMTDAEAKAGQERAQRMP
ncbi:hypothetical protein KIPB_002565 [Kipferlia bialata]|uniref:Uncharacterized protein n=1 Tax=Kipferlia bialata TaxID=797122 RepID=A0A9K3CRL2_9EUKA|nr:hypothetical protein KIPB_002565 [Kipferlia bialata]|eukprot:g2565.t1